jgi:hypothetical protein
VTGDWDRDRSPRPSCTSFVSVAPKLIFGVSRRDLLVLYGILWRLALRQPHAFWAPLKVLRRCMAIVPGASPAVGMFNAIHLHLGPFFRFLMNAIDLQIAEIDSGQWEAPIADIQESTRVGIVAQSANADVQVESRRPAARARRCSRRRR